MRNFINTNKLMWKEKSIMNKMTQIQRFMATINHEPHDEYLFYAKFTPPAQESILKATGLTSYAQLREHYGMFDPCPAYLRESNNAKESFDYEKYYTKEEMISGYNINNLGVLEVPGSSFHFTKIISPLRNATSLNEIEQYPFLDLKHMDSSHFESDVKKARNEKTVSFSSLGSIYEAAWMIRGYEPFLMDMIAEPENCEFILDKMCDTWEWLAVIAAKAGVDLLVCGDDVANQNNLMFSKDLWRKFIKSRWARVFSAAKAINPKIQIKYHSDGNVEEIIPELIDIGVTILNPCQPECMDLTAIKKKYGKNIVFDGTIGTQTTLPFGTPNDVYNEVKRVKKDLGYDGGIIIAPSHKIEPEVTVENVLAFLKACSE